MTARVLVQFTTVLKGRGPWRLQRERDGKAAKERKAKGKERLVVKCECVCVIQSKPLAAPLILSMLGCCENG